MSLGSIYVATVLKRHGYEVGVYNADYCEDKKYSNLSDMFRGNSGESIFDIEQEIVKAVAEFTPDVVGISMGFSELDMICKRVAKSIKSNFNVQVIVGGSGATLCSNKLMEDDNIDYVIRGEGEYTFLDFLRGRGKQNIPGLVYRNGSVCQNIDRHFIHNLDFLPFADIDLDLKKSKNIDNYGIMITSRGCPYNCTFCATPKLWRRKVRYHSPIYVVNEMKYRYNRRIRKFYFCDDNFNLKPKRTIEICDLIIDSGMIGIKWICEAQLKTITESSLIAMKSAGCDRIKLGIESGCDRILKLMNKGTTKAFIREKIEVVKKVGIDFSAYILIGMPTETKAEMLETYRFVKEIDPTYVSLSVVSPHPGTELYKGIGEDSHQRCKSILNENVGEEIIDKFLCLGKSEDKRRII
jgi:radical SAM superfamily enzyme YgiQ (UPF0313 family)